MLHEIHCMRMFFKCRCGEVVENQSKETHEKTHHKKTTCPHCGFTGESYLTNKHECGKKPITCEFCEAEISYDLFETHRESCGSRTTPCDICGQLVVLKDMHDHMDMHSVRPKPAPRRPRLYQSYTVFAKVERPVEQSPDLASILHNFMMPIDIQTIQNPEYPQTGEASF